MSNEVSTESAVHCTRHPSVETALACATCGTPICPKCMVVTPVGMKCPDCGRNKNNPLFKVRPERFLLAGVVALAAGAVAGLIGTVGFIFFVYIISIPYGYFAGMMILRAAGMKRGLKMEILAGTAMVLGALATKLVPVLPALLQGALGSLLVLGDISFWAAAIISTAAAVSKIRYL